MGGEGWRKWERRSKVDGRGRIEGEEGWGGGRERGVEGEDGWREGKRRGEGGERGRGGVEVERGGEKGGGGRGGEEGWRWREGER